jgi:putative transposase
MADVAQSSNKLHTHVRLSASARRAATPYPFFEFSSRSSIPAPLTNQGFMRKILSHSLPPELWLEPGREVFFITICTQPRGVNQLANPQIWQAIRETLERRETEGDFDCRLLLAMPDHLHGLFSFPHTDRIKTSISSMKSWLAKSQGIQWQRDFFDHRLRTCESAEEKRRYILMNPVRAGLAETTDSWPFKWDKAIR